MRDTILMLYITYTYACSLNKHKKTVKVKFSIPCSQSSCSLSSSFLVPVISFPCSCHLVLLFLVISFPCSPSSRSLVLHCLLPFFLVLPFACFTLSHSLVPCSHVPLFPVFLFSCSPSSIPLFFNSLILLHVYQNLINS